MNYHGSIVYLTVLKIGVTSKQFLVVYIWFEIVLDGCEFTP